MEKNLDTTQILQNLSNLRFFDEDEEQFWQEYLSNIAFLSKSPLSIVIHKDDDDSWKIQNSYIAKNIDEKLKDEILKVAVETSLRTLKQIYAYERFRDKSKQFTNHYIISISLKQIDDQKRSNLILFIPNENKIEFSNIIIRAALCRDIPLSYQFLEFDKQDEESLENLPVEYDNSEDTKSLNSENYFEQILSLLNSIIYEKKFKLALMKIADEFANKFNCNKVSIGWEKNEYINPIAINQIEHFSKASSAIKALEAIFEESYEQDEEIFYPNDENSVLITHAHKTYLRENRLSSLYTFPIRVDDIVVGVISFEKDDSYFLDKELEVIRLSLNYIAPTLQKIYLDDQNIFKKTITQIKKSSSTLLGPKNSLKKILVVTISLLLAWIVFGKLEYKVEAVSTIQTDNISYICAPFDGIVKKVNTDIGDSVEKDQIMVQFDIQELSLKKLEINSDIIKYTTEVEKARANRALADMKISQAKKEQSLTGLKKIDYYLQKANIKAPFDGIVVEGDREKLIGSPFSKGDIILQVADPVELYAKVKVLEEYIDEIKVGQIATLNLLSRPDQYFDVRIEKIIPMAKVDDVNGNVFTVKVLFLSDTQDWMRPGMSGISKIQIEDRSVLWILTHKISDYLHMNIWW